MENVTGLTPQCNWTLFYHQERKKKAYLIQSKNIWPDSFPEKVEHASTLEAGNSKFEKIGMLLPWNDNLPNRLD